MNGKWIDLRIPADELGLKVPRLVRLSLAGKFPEVLHVDRGEYRVEQGAYERWKESRMSSAINARAELSRQWAKELG